MAFLQDDQSTIFCKMEISKIFTFGGSLFSGGSPLSGFATFGGSLLSRSRYFRNFR